MHIKKVEFGRIVCRLSLEVNARAQTAAHAPKSSKGVQWQDAVMIECRIYSFWEDVYAYKMDFLDSSGRLHSMLPNGRLAAQLLLNVL